MRVFGIRSILRMAMFCICFLLIFYFGAREQFMQHPWPILGPVLAAFTIMLLRTTVIIVNRNVLKFYTLFTFVTNRPKWLFIGEIQKMHIIRHTGKGGSTHIHLLLGDRETTIYTQFAKRDIKLFEQFMSGKGIAAQNPEK